MSRNSFPAWASWSLQFSIFAGAAAVLGALPAYVRAAESPAAASIKQGMAFLEDGERQKAIDAQRLNASFGPDEASPDLVYQQISVQARQRIDALVRQAHENASYGAGDVATYYPRPEVAVEVPLT